MSFAQFEREVTAERIRDKVAASKRKGLWMGGRVPLGYEKDERTLRINEAEAETVRTLYAVLSKNTNELKTGAPGRRRVSSIIMMESATIKGLATRLCFWTRRGRADLPDAPDRPVDLLRAESAREGPKPPASESEARRPTLRRDSSCTAGVVA